MRFALRPYVIAGAAIVGAGVIVLAPSAPPLPNVEVPAVQPAGSEISGFSQQDLLGMLAATDGLGLYPEEQVITPPAESPGPARLPSQPLPPPDLGPLDMGGFQFGTGNP